MIDIPKPAMVQRPRLSAWGRDHRSMCAVNRMAFGDACQRAADDAAVELGWDLG